LCSGMWESGFDRFMEAAAERTNINRSGSGHTDFELIRLRLCPADKGTDLRTMRGLSRPPRSGHDGALHSRSRTLL
jgi:hypothetical protein